MDQAGLSEREIADYLGHEWISMMQDVYLSRGVPCSMPPQRVGLMWVLNLRVVASTAKCECPVR
ncbi:MAG: hypothetical protein M3325_05925 [Actinomycetota bacterium]|nr:hypothetical protein [Actinomycetota bacterium]